MNGLINARILGFEKSPYQRTPTTRYYEIDPFIFRTIIENITLEHLSIKLNLEGVLTPEEVDTEATQYAPLIANACMTVLYAKL